MNSDFETMQVLIVRRIADALRVPYDRLVSDMPPMFDTSNSKRWYSGVNDVLSAAPDSMVIPFPMLWKTGKPSKFVWVDRRLRVWRVNDFGFMFCSGSLA